MIYDYYCIDCGEKFRGREIRFDLAELLGLRQESNEEAFACRATTVDLNRLNEFARHSSVTNGLKHGEKCMITVTLKEFLELMAENEGNRGVFREIGECTFQKKKEILKKLYTGQATGEERDSEISSFESAIQAQFACRLDGVAENEEQDQALNCYEASFCVRPEFFEEDRENAIYTLEYNYSINAVNLRKLGKFGKIRGYCPKCGKAIVDGAGKYRHTLVGLIGAQRAGKTSTIVAILEELRTNYEALGIRYPGNPLWDSRSADREINVQLYRNGWAVIKTAVETNKGAFNATLLIEADDENRSDEQKKQIVTFADIAGEQCYNKQTNTVNTEAFQVYPLINSCHIFLLCTGIVSDAEEMNKENSVPPEAVLEISRGIYENLREPENVPPICIVVTKADLAGDAEAREEQGRKNPFQKITHEPGYQYEDEFMNLSMLYDAAVNDDIRDALDICFSAYDELSRITYVSMMSCWALGRKAEKFVGNIDVHHLPLYCDPDTGRPCPFHRMRIDRLCRWIFQTAGILEADGYSFPHIPSLGEGYLVEGLDTAGVRKRYSINEACKRIETVKKVFINCPDEEENLRSELQYFDENRRMWHWEQKRNRMLRKLLGR